MPRLVEFTQSVVDALQTLTGLRQAGLDFGTYLQLLLQAHLLLADRRLAGIELGLQAATTLLHLSQLLLHPPYPGTQRVLGTAHRFHAQRDFVHPVACRTGCAARRIQCSPQRIPLGDQFLAMLGQVLDRGERLVQAAARGLHIGHALLQLLAQIEGIPVQTLQAMPDLLRTRLLAAEQGAHLGHLALRGLQLALLHLACLLCLDQGAAVGRQLVGQLCDLRFELGQTLGQHPDLLLPRQHPGTGITAPLHADPTMSNPHTVRRDQAFAGRQRIASLQRIRQVMRSVNAVEQVQQRARPADMCRERAFACLWPRGARLEQCQDPAFEAHQVRGRGIEIVDHDRLQLLGQHHLGSLLPFARDFDRLEQAARLAQTLVAQPTLDTLVALTARGLLQGIE